MQLRYGCCTCIGISSLVGRRVVFDAHSSTLENVHFVGLYPISILRCTVQKKKHKYFRKRSFCICRNTQPLGRSAASDQRQNASNISKSSRS